MMAELKVRETEMPLAPKASAAAASTHPETVSVAA